MAHGKILTQLGSKPQMAHLNEDVQKDPETYALIGAAMEVHRQLGYGFLEAVYQDALDIELTQRSIPFQREQPVALFYKGVSLSSSCRTDFICHGSIIVELKAIRTLTNVESAQILHYLKATGFQRALLINFGGPKLEYKRFITSKNNLRSSARSAVDLQPGDTE